MNLSAQTKLADYFTRNGYYRIPNEERKLLDGQIYKKGYEVRLVAMNDRELINIQSLLKKCGFSIARPFSKGMLKIQPIYGKQAFLQFRNIVSIYLRK